MLCSIYTWTGICTFTPRILLFYSICEFHVHEMLLWFAGISKTALSSFFVQAVHQKPAVPIRQVSPSDMFVLCFLNPQVIHVVVSVGWLRHARYDQHHGFSNVYFSHIVLRLWHQCTMYLPVQMGVHICLCIAGQAQQLMYEAIICLSQQRITTECQNEHIQNWHKNVFFCHLMIVQFWHLFLWRHAVGPKCGPPWHRSNGQFKWREIPVSASLGRYRILQLCILQICIQIWVACRNCGLLIWIPKCSAPSYSVWIQQQSRR